jgi:hypothetical protein
MTNLIDNDVIFEKDLYILKNSIFEKESFTLKELCSTFILNKDKEDLYGKNLIDKSILDIINCYLYFSSGNSNYKKYLQETRLNKGIFLNNISFREMLQIFDLEFTKLVIRIKTEPKNYDITITWDEFNNKMKNVNKDELYEFYKKFVDVIKN